MIENIVTCDRCKKQCEDTTYYTIDIYANDIKSTGDGSITMKTASQNAQTNTYKLFNQEIIPQSLFLKPQYSCYQIFKELEGDRLNTN